MKVVVRVDSSSRIGSGHLMRCLTLAGSLRELGDDVTFLCRDLPGNVTPLIEREGFRVLRIPEESPERDGADCRAAIAGLREVVDWVVVDHYGLDSRWESTVADSCRAILVIDDLADRPHRCDILLDQNLTRDGAERYRALVPEDCLVLCGPEHALLRPEFTEVARARRRRDGTIRRILVTFGGVDESGETGKVARAIRDLDRPDIAVDLVVGASNPRGEELRRFCAGEGAFSFHRQVDNMAELMAAADLCVGAGGSTTWERASMGLATVMITIADNQTPVAEATAAAGAAWNLGPGAGVTVGALTTTLRRLLDRPDEVLETGRRARSLLGDGSIPSGAALARLMRERRHADS